MMIPQEWLIGPITPADVEETLAEEGAADSWLLQWHALLERRVAGDEIREYSGAECAPAESPSAGEVLRVHWGFALVCDGAIVDWIEAQW